MTRIETPHMIVITPGWTRAERTYTFARQHSVLVHNCDDVSFVYAWPTTTTKIEVFTAAEIGQLLGGN